MKQGMTGWSYSGWWALIGVGSCCSLCGDGAGRVRRPGRRWRKMGARNFEGASLELRGKDGGGRGGRDGKMVEEKGISFLFSFLSPNLIYLLTSYIYIYIYKCGLLSFVPVIFLQINFFSILTLFLNPHNSLSDSCIPSILNSLPLSVEY